jgi:hypothetical protein
MASIPMNTPGRRGCWVALSLLCATVLPAWPDQSVLAGTGQPRSADGAARVDQGFTPASPPPLSVPTWTPLPLAPEASPGWVVLPGGPGPAPGWSPPSPPLINNAPLWQGL